MNNSYRLFVGDCEKVLSKFKDNYFDSIVTDPPYGLSFMGKKWDYQVPSVSSWIECLRVLKPGGHLLCFAGTRTQHRMCVNIEDAGFEIRDMIAWVYGSGFPKSLNISKAIDKAAGAKRKVVGTKLGQPGYSLAENKPDRTAYGDYTDAESECNITAPATEAAQQWDGWGTALKPAFEPITVARKPFKGTVVNNVLKHGTGGINVDATRIMTEAQSQSRFPANLIHDGSDEVVGLFPGKGTKGADRFFYCAKAAKKDRGKDNKHPTVKPTELMRYLVRLVTPPQGLVLDPYMGSGSTGKACGLERFKFVGIELEEESMVVSSRRVREAYKEH